METYNIKPTGHRSAIVTSAVDVYDKRREENRQHDDYHVEAIVDSYLKLIKDIIKNNNKKNIYIYFIYLYTYCQDFSNGVL